MTVKPVYVFSSDAIGQGSAELGEILARGMFRTLTTVEPTPEVIIFLNSGVKLLIKEDIWESIQILEEKGINILACGTCLDYYQLKDQVRSDLVSNMKDILTTISNAPKVVNF